MNPVHLASLAPRTAHIRRGSHRSQRGVIVFIALIALVILSLAAVALIRSTDTAGVIAGNVAFKEATTGAADTGAERAFNALPALAAAGDTDVAGQYFALKQAVDANGIPTTIDWTQAPCYDTKAGTDAISCTDESAYRVQYVIDRLCTSAPSATDPVTLLTSKCVAGQPFSANNGKTGEDLNSHARNTHNKPADTSLTRPTIHYRVTVRVLGPRNTVSFVQTTIELPFPSV